MSAAMLFLGLLLQTARDSPAQTSAVGTAMIGGVVTTGTEATTRTPLRRAAVTIAGTGIVGPRLVMTDDAGRFVFSELPAGRFTVTVEKPGYLKTYVGSRRPGRPPSTPIAVVTGQRILDLAINAPRGAVIEGTVRDEFGLPIPTSQVTARQLIVVGGAPQYVPVTSTPSRVVADDRGRYRLYGLPPGEYVIEASGGTSGLLGGAEIATDDEIKTADEEAQRATAAAAPPTKPRQVRGVTRSIVYAPGVSDIRAAQTVLLALSEERTGVDVVSPLVGAARVELMITAPSGLPVTNGAIGVANVSRQSVAFSQGIVRPSADGRFVLPGLSPATYLFYGIAPDPPASTGPPWLWLGTEVIVDGVDLSGVALTFAHGQTVSGRLSAAASLPPLGAARLTLTPVVTIPGVALMTPTTTPAADGSFQFTSVPPGRYRLTFSGIAGWSLTSAMHDGRDSLDALLDVGQGADIDGLVGTLTDRLTEISGMVTDASGRPSPEFTALVFPADRALRLTAPRRTSGLVKIASDGRFRVEGLPPGDYLLAVIVDADPQQLNDPAFLEQVAAGAIAINLAEGQKLVQDLKIGG
jgi:hypothetical protein